MTKELEDIIAIKPDISEEGKEALKKIKELKAQHNKPPVENNIFEEQAKEINYLEARVQELTNLIKQKKEKMVDIFKRLLPDKKKELELIQDLVFAHLDFIKAKKQRVPSTIELRNQRDALRKELEELLGNNLAGEIEFALDDWEELVTWELEREEKSNKKSLLLGEQILIPQINITSNVENNNNNSNQGYLPIKRQITFPQRNEKEQNLLLAVPTKQAQTKPDLKHPPIGKGGYGEVYYGKWGLQDVAVKKLFLSLNNISQKDLKEIMNEINTLKNLRNRHIIQYYDTYSDNQEILIIMDYAENGTLTKFINDHVDKEHDWNFNANLIKQIILGLAYIHQQGIIHRDLKSMNILLADNYQAKISDFGLSKTKNISASQSKQGAAVGTLRWMAPELLKGQKCSEQSDVYALGMIIWEIAAKCTIPFEDIDNNLIAFRIIDGEKETIPSDTPQNIQHIIQQCWKDNPSERITLANMVEIIDYAAAANPEQELSNRTKRQLSLESQAKNSQGEAKLLKIIDGDGQICHSEPMTIDLTIANQSWQNIHPSFIPQLIQTWQNHHFTYQQVRDWINIHSPADQIQAIQEPEFYAWLRDIKKVDSDWVLNHGNHQALKQEYQAYQQTPQILHQTNHSHLK